MAENEIKSISISEAAILIEDKTVVFVDVRDINEVKKHGEIPGLDARAAWHARVFD